MAGLQCNSWLVVGSQLKTTNMKLLGRRSQLWRQSKNCSAQKQRQKNAAKEDLGMLMHASNEHLSGKKISLEWKKDQSDDFWCLEF